ncbi:conjugal transfer protein TraL [Skermanella stibiiresistens SB22]|uniref:Conjugal transfer protein TraL n=1 Tax=Skermanella stibiiresistens SB22 TaxID=1385369 RepID=W9GU37_9PROT|nr:type IV conjugative transfer system protein TraL [Skermanella stibiiresistens]EWY36151.1 conjugal transfer protein TraL [Skermanella stibiiresistens SB22]
MDVIDIPRRIDAPRRLLLWTTDEVVPVAVGVMVGITVDRLLLCAAIGFVFVRFYRRFRDGRADGYLLHALYWAGITKPKGHSFPNPFVSRWLP